MKNSRRDFLKKSTTLALGALAAPSILDMAFAAEPNTPPVLFAPNEGGDFTLPDLPYSYDALEPHIDALTMEIHHSKHHKGYVTNLNKALAEADLKKLKGDHSLENILRHVAKMPEAVRNNAGGHYNHTLFWAIMKPNGGGKPTGTLADAITASFGSFEEFQKQFNEAASKRFGSGWAWLVKTDSSQLMITSTPNQDNPLMNLKSIEVKGRPILGLDVWEHAYYLKNQNRRGDYINSWWNVVGWDRVSELYTAS